MKLKPPRRKKHCKVKFKSNNLFPKLEAKSHLVNGRFNGFSVIIEDQNDIDIIHSSGYFGKGCFSRSFPHLKYEKTPHIIRKRQFGQRLKWNDLLENKIPEDEDVIILKDSDSEDDSYFNNLQPGVSKTLKIQEYLHLSLEEAYFLMSTIECLNIYCDNKKLSQDEAWRLFCENQENFVQNYVAYYYFRVRNWIVKTGIKFGSDFLLYHKGPEHFHASYAVVIHVLKCDTMEPDEKLCRENRNWTYLIGLNRLALTASKDLVICQIIWPQDVSMDVIKSCCNMKLFSVNTVIMRRWVASQERLKN